MKKEDYQNLGKFLLLVILVLSIWFIGWIVINRIETDPTKQGVFGDKFGFTNSLFSALGLAGIIYSILLQQKELNLQRKELSDTRDEFKDQNFQTTFFNLLKTQSQIATEISVKIWNLRSYDAEVSKDFDGRKFFNQSKSELSRIVIALTHPRYSIYHKWDEHDDQHGPNSAEEAEATAQSRNITYTFFYYNITEDMWKSAKKMQPIEMAKFAYGIFFNRFHYVVGHYFRHIYHILNFLNKTEIQKINNLLKPDDKLDVELEFQQYADFVQAQMSAPELFLLFYNSLPFPKLQVLLIKYKILENLPVEDLISPAHNCIEGIILKKRTDLLS